jgi:hydrogenase-4 component B
MIWVGWGVALLLAAAVAVLLLRHRAFAADQSFRVLVIGGCVVAAIPALRTIRRTAATAGTTVELVQRGPWAFGLDSLSAWFLLVILAVGAATAAYGPSYLAPERGRRNVAAAHALLALLLVALLGVVIAQSAVAFLAAWEVMAVCAYLLILFEGEDAEVRRAGFIYLILTHLSMLALLAMFASIPASGSNLTFAAIAQRRAAIIPAAGPFFAFALVGFGLKAGAVPLHFWLPGAHAAAPSHVSALFSGVMIKTGIYGLFRIITLFGAPPAWFGWVLLGLGLSSGILGVLWALAQHDLKRLLAYHSVENFGIILLGMGVGVLGVAYVHTSVAVLGFAGALLLTLYHERF